MVETCSEADTRPSYPRRGYQVDGWEDEWDGRVSLCLVDGFPIKRAEFLSVSLLCVAFTLGWPA